MAKAADSRKVASKREREKETVSLMIALFCRKQHAEARAAAGLSRDELCPECRELNDYARTRSDRCPFMETKTFCSNCRVHCYKPDMRERIREVMRFSGPRMIFHHPVMALRHVIASKREARRLAAEEAGLEQ